MALKWSVICIKVVTVKIGKGPTVGAHIKWKSPVVQVLPTLLDTVLYLKKKETSSWKSKRSVRLGFLSSDRTVGD